MPFSELNLFYILALLLALIVTVFAWLFLAFKIYNVTKKEKKLVILENQTNAIYEENLFKLANLSQSEAKELILKNMHSNAESEFAAYKDKYLSNLYKTLDLEAKEIVSLAVQRCSSEVVNEFTITNIKINDEDKGKLIGKSGRNIQWFEQILGVELIIDEAPNVVTISGFNSIRRAIAKRTIEKLLENGKIHPSIIEEMHTKSKNEILVEMESAGQIAVDTLGIVDFPLKLIKLIGRLKFRTGYGQNMLKHSLEMAKLAGLMADSLNAKFISSKKIDKLICMKGALLHDIGKAIDEEMEPKGNHIEIGEEICDIFSLDWRIKKCISSHHTTGGDRQSYTDAETGQFCIEAVVVDACDSISGGRLGARKEDNLSYFNRVEMLENYANSINDVKNCWIMRGGKELWVFFNPSTVSTESIPLLVNKIAKEVNENIKTPYEIKIVGIREDRVEVFSR
jgi:ribonucrease Y